jgi:hypothetical protein
LHFKEFADDIKKLVKLKAFVINENEGSSNNVESWMPEYSGGSKRLDLHSFDGDNPFSWVYKANQFFFLFFIIKPLNLKEC